MTPAFRLAKECGYDADMPTTRLAFQGFSIETFYARAQAQALTTKGIYGSSVG